MPRAQSRSRALTAAATLPALALAAVVVGCGGAPQAAAQATTPSTTPAGPALGNGEVLLFPNEPAVRMPLAAGEGHVVVTRPTATGSDLIDVSEPGKPRTLQSFKGAPAIPSIGTDAAGRPVAVVSPCLSAQELGVPRCELHAIDLATGNDRPLRGSKFAYVGDLDRGRALVVRRPKGGGVRLAQTRGTTDTYAAVPLTAITVGGKSVPYTSSQYGLDQTSTIGSLDAAGNVIAATILFGNPGDYGGSLLLRGTSAGRWTKLAASGYGLMNGDRREFRATTVTPTGVRAVYDGGTNDDPYAARWNAAGKLVKRLKLPDGFDVAFSAFDGDRLVRVNSGDFGFEGGPSANGVIASGPYSLG